MAERISYTTDDGVIIVGDWFTAPTMLGAVILFHMMPANRSSWGLLQRELAKRGLASLAVDFRGHGDSTETEGGAKLDYREFEDAEHQDYIADAIQAVDWVRKRGLDRERIALAGASIGANIAIQMLTEEPQLAGAALLSPGADYHGVKGLEDAAKLLAGQSLFVVSSEDDKESFTDSKKLYEMAPVDNKIFVPYKSAGHGTNIFNADKGLLTKTADWLAETIRG